MLSVISHPASVLVFSSPRVLHAEHDKPLSHTIPDLVRSRAPRSDAISASFSGSFFRLQERLGRVCWWPVQTSGSGARILPPVSHLQLSSWALYRSPVSVAQKDSTRHVHLLLGSIDGYTPSYMRPYRADPKRARANPTRSDAAHARLGCLGPDPRRTRLRSRFSLPQNPTSAGSWYRRRRSQFCALSDP